MRGISQIERDLSLPECKFPGPIPVVQDSNEQTPFEFPSDKFRVEIRALAAGDYSIAGFEGEFAIERKNSIEELSAWFTKGHDKFIHEITLLSKIPASVVVVESGLITDIYNHQYKTDATPVSMIGNIMCALWRFKVPVMFCETRQCAQQFVQHMMCQFCDKTLDKFKKMKKAMGA